VRACNATTGCGAWSATRTEHVRVPPVPTNLHSNESTSHDGAYHVGWNAAAHADRYQLQESKNGHQWTNRLNGSARSWSASGQGNGSYRYRVRACNGTTGCSAWSGTVAVQVARIP